jgi:hypothetical protein
MARDRLATAAIIVCMVVAVSILPALHIAGRAQERDSSRVRPRESDPSRYRVVFLSFLLQAAFPSFLDEFIDGRITKPCFSILGIIPSSLAHLLDEPYRIDGAERIYQRFVSSLAQFLWIRYRLDHLVYPSQWI